MNQVQILVLDFGSQYTQLIARRLREFGVYTEIVPYFETIQSIRAKNPKGIILSGGPASVYEEGAYMPDSEIFNLGIPVLGICYGMQYIAYHFGGEVIRAKEQEFGRARLEILPSFIAKKFSQSSDVERIFLTWRDAFFSSHSFMSKNMLDDIAQTLYLRVKESQNLLLADDFSSFGFYDMLDDICYFECYKINHDISQQDLVRDFLYAIAGNAKRFQTQWDIHDESGINAFLALGFSKGEKHGKMIDLMLEVSYGNLFENVGQDSIVWMSHADKVCRIPEGFVELARSNNTRYCVIANFTKNIYAMQFHPEVVHTQYGGLFLKNFAVNICKSSTDWNMKNFIEHEIQRIRNIVGID